MQEVVKRGYSDLIQNSEDLSSTKQNAFLDYRFRRKIDIVHSDNLATTLSKSYNREKISYLKKTSSKSIINKCLSKCE